MTSTSPTDELQQRRFMKALLTDVHAFERMLEEDRFETGIRRIGAEQEMFLVDSSMRPMPVADAVLRHADRPELVNELAQFNLEANSSPLVFGGQCLSKMESELRELVRAADVSAESQGARILLTGILPTLRLQDLTLANMTPKARYMEINEATCAARGGHFHVLIKGNDELELTHDNVMLESCNTSFQLHFQVAPAEFSKLYNTAQAITAPVLAAAVNSPVLLGRQLWNETRVALFQHSVDSRSTVQKARNVRPRVSFGDAWVKESAAEVWRENISRFRVLFVTDLEEDPDAVLDADGIPELSALRLHNGTVYRWNRVCYGHDGVRPHLRIENRVLPAGPTILDQMANAAFYYGLMAACVEEYGQIHEHMLFEDAKSNFFAAARHGLNAQFTWLDGETIPASELILDRLLPMARQGLRSSEIDEADIERYLSVLENRVSCGSTGSRWVRESLRNMADAGSGDVRDRALTAVMLKRQDTDAPVHEWASVEPAELQAVLDSSDAIQTVGQFMSTDLFTVRPGDLVDLAASLMDWEHVRHVPVEDDQAHLVGLLSHRSLLRLVARGRGNKSEEPVAVSDIMNADPVTVSSDTSTLDAIAVMRREKVGCLPVVDEGKLVGIITERDFIGVAARLLDGHLRGTKGPEQEA
jgi:CBS domain-containing protein/gamma-glutamyl:cysteine ligase YbdK (ATP-grasp superfamily)